MTTEISESIQATPSGDSATSWFHKLQSDYVLSAARVIYLIFAVICILVAVGGLLVMLYFQMKTWQSPSQDPVPDVPEVSRRALDADSVSAFLAPPGNIKVHAEQVTNPVSEKSVVAYFSVDTPNSLAAFPEDIMILGGKDASFFKLRGVRYDKGKPKRSGLSPSSELVSQINDYLSSNAPLHSRNFQLKVAARDKYGTPSVPQEIVFSIAYGSAAVANEAVQPASNLTGFQEVARDIALVVDPSRTPDYFKAFKRANRLPRDCGANESDVEFSMDVRRVLDAVRSQLSADNIEAFYAGICTAWQNARRAEQSERAQAEEIRREIMARNSRARAETEFAAARARVGRYVTLGVIGAAIGLFLVISLLLAFLAIENHTKAVREVLAALLPERNPQSTLR